MGHHKKKKGKKDSRSDDKDNEIVNQNQQLKNDTPVDTFFNECYDISMNTDMVDVTTQAFVFLDVAGSPAQVTGVTANAVSYSQINLSWNANSEADLRYYNIYRGTTAGFSVTLGTTVPIARVLAGNTTYSDTGLATNTTYYYKISASDYSDNYGTLSSEVNATVTLTPNIDLRLDNDYTDSSGLGNTVTPRIAANNAPAFATPGKFGTHYGLLNWPNISTPSTPDRITIWGPPETDIDWVNGFTFSFWIQPKNITSLGQARFIFGKSNSGTTGDYFQVGINTVGDLFVEMVPSTGGFANCSTMAVLSINTWYHIVITWNGSTSLKLYQDKVLSTDTSGGSGGFAELSPSLHIGFRSNNAAATYYQGYLDELKYYRGIVATQTQVNNLFNTNAL